MSKCFLIKELKNKNHFYELNQKVKYYENLNDYKNGMEAFADYVNYIRTMKDPITLINSYLRFTKYCIQNNDILFARDLYKEAQILIKNYELFNNSNIQPEIHKISMNMSFPSK